MLLTNNRALAERDADQAANYESRLRATGILTPAQVARLSVDLTLLSKLVVFKVVEHADQQIDIVVSLVKFLEPITFTDQRPSLRIVINKKYLQQHPSLYYEGRFSAPVFEFHNYFFAVLPFADPGVRLQRIFEQGLRFLRDTILTNAIGNGIVARVGDVFPSSSVSKLKGKAYRGFILDGDLVQGYVLVERQEVLVFRRKGEETVLQWAYPLRTLSKINRDPKGVSRLVFQLETSAEHVGFKADYPDFFTMELLEKKESLELEGEEPRPCRNPITGLKQEIEVLESGRLEPSSSRELVRLYQELIELLSANDDPELDEYLGRMKRKMACKEFVRLFSS